MRALVGRALAASLLVTFVPRTALADDLDTAMANARGQNLPINAAAEQLANQSAAAQASAGRIFHIDLHPLLGPCTAAGEVVGVGPDVATVVRLLVASPPHWHIISDGSFTAIGTAQIRGADARLYISVIYCVAAGAPTPARPPKVATTTTAPTPPPPRPAPRPPEVTPPSLTSPDGSLEVSVLLGVLDFLPPEEWRVMLQPAIS